MALSKIARDGGAAALLLSMTSSSMTSSTGVEPPLELGGGPSLSAAASGPSPAWGTEIRAQIAASEYGVRETKERFRASNRAQHLEALFAEHGAEFSVDSGGGAGVRLQPVSLSRGGAPRALSPGRVALGDCNADGSHDLDGECLRRVELRHRELTEVWENRPAGLEQIFVVPAAPEGRGDLELRVVVEHAQVSIAADGKEATFSNPGRKLELRYAGLDVRDAEGRSLPVHLEARPRGFALVVADADAKYPIVVDPLLTSLWSVDGDQALTELGSSIAGAGDVNGDGFDDILVATPLYSHGEPYEGRVFLYLGSPSGPSHTPAWSAEGNQFHAFFGSAVAAAGDVNGDGLGDVLVGAPSFDSSALWTDNGAVYVYLGTSSGTGLQPLPAWQRFGSQNHERWGSSVASAGDFDGDGVADFVVGSPLSDSGTVLDAGMAAVFLGVAGAAPLTSPWLVVRGSQVAEHLGQSVGSAGDVDCDGKSDVVVGSPYFDTATSADAGRVQLFRGPVSGTTPAVSASWSAEGTQSQEAFGYAVASAGVQHLFPSPALMVGAPFFDDGQTDEGAVFVYRNDACSLSTTPGWSKQGDADDANFGYQVASAGDVNGDGFGELLVGAPGLDNGDGRVTLYMGRMGGPGNVGAIWRGYTLGGQIGGALSSAGDVDGDGYADILLGVHTGFGTGTSLDYAGRVVVYSGGGFGLGSNPVATLSSGQLDDRFGFSVATAGDVDGSGWGDVIVGAPHADGNGSLFSGRIHVFNGGLFGLIPGFTEPGEVSTFEELGAWVASAGDVNGDGFGDVTVGAPLFGNDGRARIFFGSAAGLQKTSPAPASLTPSGGLGAGKAVAGAGDVNGDGFADVIMGVPFTPVSPPSNLGTGKIRLFFGSGSGQPASVADVFGNEIDSKFGTSVASAGDVDGDGFADVIVGAPDALVDRGVAFIFYGNASGVDTTSPTFLTGSSGQHLGRVVASAGDINGDGYGDVAIVTGLGNVLVYQGDSQRNVNNVPPLSLIGETVASAGDVNNDGFADLIIGQPSAFGGTGQAVLMLGSSSGLVPSATWVGADPQATRFGTSVASAGDVNGDGFGDVIVGATASTGTGRAYVYLGNGAANDGTGLGLGLRRLRPLRAATTSPIAPGNNVISRGTNASFDVNLGVAPPNFGARAKVQVEVKPSDVRFDGTSLTSSTTFVSTGVGGSLTQRVGLPRGKAYHYRARLLFDPNQPVGTQRGPWMYGGVSGQPTSVHLRAPLCPFCSRFP